VQYLSRVVDSAEQPITGTSDSPAGNPQQQPIFESATGSDQDELAGVVLLISGGMFAFFLILNVAALLPLRIREPVWLLSAIGSVYGSIFYPLLGVGLIALLVILRPEDPRPRRWLARCRRLSLAVMVGFLLLIPLQITGIARLAVLQDVPATRTLSTITAVTTQVRAAATVPELAQVISRLPNAPQLPGNIDANSFPPFKQQLIAELERNIKRLQAEQREARQQRFFNDVGTGIKGTIVCLLFSLIFAGLGQSHPSKPSVLGGFLMRRASRQERSEQRRREWLEQQQQQRLDREHAEAMKSFREMAQANRKATKQRSERLPRIPKNPAPLDQPAGWRRWWPARRGGSATRGFGPTIDRVDPYISQLAALNEADAADQEAGQTSNQGQSTPPKDS
jgi:hypothetical protein